MNTYNVPRNVKGEGRILYIFSIKALIYTVIGAGIGLVPYIIMQLISRDKQVIGLIVIATFGLIGFLIGTFKIPNTNAFEFTRKTGGENIDEIIKRAIKFKMKKTKSYVYQNIKPEITEETKQN